MLKTHLPHHRPGPRHHVGHFLNLLAVAERVGHRLERGMNILALVEWK